MNTDSSAIAQTPDPPYYAVIFTSLRGESSEGYAEMNARLEAFADEQPGFLGLESARDGLGISVSYWRDLESIRAWYDHAIHREAQRLGRERWYTTYAVRVARVEKAYGYIANT